jgi:hypothetical protein
LPAIDYDRKQGIKLTTKDDSAPQLAATPVSVPDPNLVSANPAPLSDSEDKAS